MLSRTADHIYWAARYLERAANTIRLLSVCYITAPMSNNDEAINNSWRSVLETLETLEEFQEVYSQLNADVVMNYVVANSGYSSSIISCMTAARENVRAIRGTLSSEVWEAVNGTWLDLKRLLEEQTLNEAPRRVFDWLGARLNLINGVVEGTMRRNEAYHFMRLGLYLERADNTARMLNTRFFMNENFESDESLSINRLYHWSAVLQALSSLEIYRQVVRDAIEPNKVMGLIILERHMPHSLAYATEGIYNKLRTLANSRSSQTERLAGKLEAKLRFITIEEIQENGLQDFLVDYLEMIQLIGEGIHNDFLWPAEEHHR